jgi:peroxiredoxin Q/BCP
MSSLPQIGTEAPPFEGRIQDGSLLRLSELRGNKVVLYFYPKDDTPGCTKQACSLRDGWEELQAAGIQVVGVSQDDVESHEKFAEKYDLPFPIVADPDHDILKRYGVWGERSMFGNTFMGTKRTTFLIDEEGIIREIIKKPATADHAREVREKWRDVEETGTA